MESTYFHNERPEIVAQVEPATRHILDIGCAAGRLGAALKRENPQRRVYGIERNATVAREARKVLDKVFVGDIETMRPPLRAGSFDCLLFADVLEHVVDPLAVLKRYRRYLRPGGYILSSIPNMSHYTVFIKLLLRGWQYEEQGLFDRTHLRFFSLPSMRELMTQAGFQIEQITPIIVASRKMKALNTLLGNSLEQFVAMQYLVKARRA